MKVGITSTCFYGAFEKVFPDLTLIKPGPISYDMVMQYQLVIVPGGADVSPDLYGEINYHSSCDAARDQHESAVIRACINSKIPLYGSCRGAQLLAVMSGSRLVQDIGIQMNSTHRSMHSIAFYDRSDSLFRDLIPMFKNGVNSLHHQGVSAAKYNGIVPLAEHNGIVELMQGRQWLGTQFHPEIMDNAVQFFDWLCEIWLPSVTAKPTTKKDSSDLISSIVRKERTITNNGF
jgi:putative glutamine amidotransferase